jgi:hypothetical protein
LFVSRFRYYYVQHPAVRDLFSDKGQQSIVIHRSKIVFQIRIYDPLVSGLHFTPDLGQRIGCLATLPIPKTARIHTNKDFAANVRLYLGLGYKVDREEPFMNGVTVHMSKKLHSPAIEP